jgi:hypothetical protein
MCPIDLQRVVTAAGLVNEIDDFQTSLRDPARFFFVYIFNAKAPKMRDTIELGLTNA